MDARDLARAGTNRRAARSRLRRRPNGGHRADGLVAAALRRTAERRSRRDQRHRSGEHPAPDTQRHLQVVSISGHDAGTHGHARGIVSRQARLAARGVGGPEGGSVRGSGRGASAPDRVQRAGRGRRTVHRHPDSRDREAALSGGSGRRRPHPHPLRRRVERRHRQSRHERQHGSRRHVGASGLGPDPLHGAPSRSRRTDGSPCGTAAPLCCACGALPPSMPRARWPDA